jgi:hypothetical protein
MAITKNLCTRRVGAAPSGLAQIEPNPDPALQQSIQSTPDISAGNGLSGGCFN